MGLTQINVWIDAVFTTLYPIIVLALSVHFFGNILTGRAKRRFGREWAWPHHDSHPPMLPKFLHFTHVACMIVLGATGRFSSCLSLPPRAVSIRRRSRHRWSMW